MFLEVSKALYLHDYKILVHFNNGVAKTIDLKDELVGSALEPLKDVDYFKAFSFTFNTIEWQNGADFAPEFLYEIGVETVSDLCLDDNTDDLAEHTSNNCWEEGQRVWDKQYE